MSRRRPWEYKLSDKIPVNLTARSLARWWTGSSLSLWWEGHYWTFWKWCRSSQPFKSWDGEPSNCHPESWKWAGPPAIICPRGSEQNGEWIWSKLTSYESSTTGHWAWKAAELISKECTNATLMLKNCDLLLFLHSWLSWRGEWQKLSAAVVHVVSVLVMLQEECLCCENNDCWWHNTYIHT